MIIEIVIGIVHTLLLSSSIYTYLFHVRDTLWIDFFPLYHWKMDDGKRQRQIISIFNISSTALKKNPTFAIAAKNHTEAINNLVKYNAIDRDRFIFSISEGLQFDSDIFFDSSTFALTRIPAVLEWKSFSIHRGQSKILRSKYHLRKPILKIWRVCTTRVLCKQTNRMGQWIPINLNVKTTNI